MKTLADIRQHARIRFDTLVLSIPAFCLLGFNKTLFHRGHLISAEIDKMSQEKGIYINYAKYKIIPDYNTGNPLYVKLTISSKDLRENYFSLIGFDNIRQVLEAINVQNIITLDIEKTIEHAMVKRCDPCIDINIGANSIDECRHVIHKITSAIYSYKINPNYSDFTIFKDNIHELYRSVNMRKRMTKSIYIKCYYKHDELLMSRNELFRNTISPDVLDKILNQSTDILRVELNISHKADILKLLNVKSQSLSDVLGSIANPIYSMMYDLRLIENRLNKSMRMNTRDSYVARRNYEGDKKIILVDCQGDIRLYKIYVKSGKGGCQKFGKEHSLRFYSIMGEKWRDAAANRDLLYPFLSCIDRTNKSVLDGAVLKTNQEPLISVN